MIGDPTTIVLPSPLMPTEKAKVENRAVRGGQPGSLGRQRRRPAARRLDEDVGGVVTRPCHDRAAVTANAHELAEESGRIRGG